MANKSHYNSGHRGMNLIKKNGGEHSSFIKGAIPDKTRHALYIEDAVKFLKKVPDLSIQLVLIDPPYNLELDTWDNFENYLDWARLWLDEIYRILKDSGSCVIFGGFNIKI